MATSYTSLLGLALPVTGELSGTWGDTVNDYITQYLDAAIAGTQTISGSQTAVTLSKTTNASLGQAGSGATGSSQYQIINCTGNPASLLTITVPAASKAYLVLNNTSTNQSVKVVGAGPTTGVTVAAARCALIAWNGSDFELVASTDVAALQGLGTGVATALGVNVGTAGAFVVNGGALGTPSSGTVTNLTGTASININGTVGATTPTTGAFTTLTTSSTVTLNGGTANGVAYLNGSKVLTSGSALTFDGTNFATTGTTTATRFIPSGSTVATNGMYLPAANSLGFSTNSTNAVYIDSSQNVGIGTSSPADRLHVVKAGIAGITVGDGINGNAPTIIINGGTDSSNGPNIFGKGNGNNEWFISSLRGAVGGGALGMVDYVYGANPRVFYTNASERMRIDGSGNVGIGTSSPAYRLDAQSSNAFVARIATSSTNAVLLFADPSTTGAGPFVGSAGNSLTFGRAGVAEYMRIDSSGNVGIGTSSPQVKMDVVDSNPTRGIITRVNNSASSGHTGSQIQFTQIGVADWVVGQPAGASAFVFWKDRNPTIDGSELMRIDSSGNVGIGTSSPDSRLHVRTNSDSPALRVYQSKNDGGSTAVVDIIDDRSFAGVNSGAVARIRAWNTGDDTGSLIEAYTTSDGFANTSPVLYAKLNGNVGIGTSSPQGTLHVTRNHGSQPVPFGSEPQIIVGGAQGGAGAQGYMGSLWFASADGDVDFGKAAGIVGNAVSDFSPTSRAGYLEFYTTAVNSITPTERMRIDSSGNVGIGTSSPGVKLALQIAGDDGINIATSDPNKTFSISYDTTNNIVKIGHVFSNGYAVTPLTFWTNQTERARIDSSGNVGIGTSSPTAKLDVDADTVRVRTAKTPASATAAGNAGDICWDSSYVYVCVATNTWKRAAIATW